MPIIRLPKNRKLYLFTALVALVLALVTFTLAAPTHPLNPLNLIAEPVEIAKVSEIERKDCKGCSGKNELFWSTKDATCKSRESQECGGKAKSATENTGANTCVGNGFECVKVETGQNCITVGRPAGNGACYGGKEICCGKAKTESGYSAIVTSDTGDYCNINGVLYKAGSVKVRNTINGQPVYMECIGGKWAETTKTTVTPEPGTTEYSDWADTQNENENQEAVRDLITECQENLRTLYLTTGEGQNTQAYREQQCGKVDESGEIILTEGGLSYIENMTQGLTYAQEQKLKREQAACTGCDGRNLRVWNSTNNTCERKEFVTCIEEVDQKEQDRLAAVGLAQQLVTTGSIDTSYGLGLELQTELTTNRNNASALRAAFCNNPGQKGPILEDCQNSDLAGLTVEDLAIQKIFELSPDTYQDTVNRLTQKAEAELAEQQLLQQTEITRLATLAGTESIANADAQRLTAQAAAENKLVGTSAELILASRGQATETIQKKLSACINLCDKRYSVNGACIATAGGDFECINTAQLVSTDGVLVASTSASLNLASLRGTRVVGGGGAGSATVPACGGMLDRCCIPGIGADQGVASACNTGLRCNQDLNICVISTAYQQAQAVSSYITSNPNLTAEEILTTVQNNASFSLRGEDPQEILANLQNISHNFCDASCSGACIYNVNANRHSCVTDDTLARVYAEVYSTSLNDASRDTLKGEYGQECRTMWGGLFPRCNNDLLTCNQTTNRCDFTAEAKTVIANQALNGQNVSASVINLSLFAPPAVTDIASSSLLAKAACVETGQAFVSGSSCWLCRSTSGSKSLQKLGPADLCSQGESLLSLLPGQSCRARGGWCGKGKGNSEIADLGASDCLTGETCLAPKPGTTLAVGGPGDICSKNVSPSAPTYVSRSGSCAVGLTCFEGTCQEDQVLAFNETYAHDQTAERIEDIRIIGPIASAFKRSGFLMPTTYHDAIQTRAATTLAMINSATESIPDLSSLLFSSLDEAGQARLTALKLSEKEDLSWIDKQYLQGIDAWQFLSAYTGEPPISRGGAAGTNAFLEYAERNAELNAEVFAENADANYWDLLGSGGRLAAAAKPGVQAAFFVADVTTGIGAGLVRSGAKAFAIRSGQLLTRSVVTTAREAGFREAASLAFNKTLLAVSEPDFVFRALVPDLKVGNTTLRAAFATADQWTVDFLGRVISAPFRGTSKLVGGITETALRNGFGSEDEILALALRNARSNAVNIPDITVQPAVFDNYLNDLLDQTRANYLAYSGAEIPAGKIDELRATLKIDLVSPKPVSPLAYKDFTRTSILKNADLSTEAGRNEFIQKLVARRSPGISPEQALAQAKTFVSMLELANKYGLKDGGEINKLVLGYNNILTDVTNKGRPLTLAESLFHLSDVSESTRNIFAQALQAERFTTLVASGVPGAGPITTSLVDTSAASRNFTNIESIAEQLRVRGLNVEPENLESILPLLPPGNQTDILAEIIAQNPVRNGDEIANILHRYRENLITLKNGGDSLDPNFGENTRALLSEFGLSDETTARLLDFQLDFDNVRALLDGSPYTESELIELVVSGQAFGQNQGTSALAQIINNPIGDLSARSKYTLAEAEYLVRLVTAEPHANLIVPKENALFGTLKLRPGDTITAGGKATTLERGMFVQIGDAPPRKIGYFGTTFEIPSSSSVRIGSTLDEAGNIVSPRRITKPTSAKFTPRTDVPILERLGLKNDDGSWFFQSSPERDLARALEKLDFAVISPDDPIITNLTRLLPEADRAEAAVKIIAYAQNIKTGGNHLDPRALLVEVRGQSLSLQDLVESRALRPDEVIEAGVGTNRFGFLFESDGKTYGVFRDETGRFNRMEVTKSGNSWMGIENTTTSNTALSNLLPAPEKITTLTLPSNPLPQGAHLTGALSLDGLSGKNIDLHLARIERLATEFAEDPAALRAALSPYGLTDSQIDDLVVRHAKVVDTTPLPPAGAVVDTPPSGAVADTPPAGVADAPQTAPDDVIARTEADKIVQEEAPPVDLVEPSVDINELVVEEVIDNVPAPSLSQVWAGSRVNPKNWDLLEKLPFVGKETQRANQAIRAAIETQTQKLTQKAEGLLMQGYSDKEVRALIKQDLDSFIAHNNIEIGITQRGIVSEALDRVFTDSTVSYRGTVQNPSKTEARRIVNESVIKGSPGAEKVPQLTPEYLASQGLEPVESITIGNTTIHISRPYSDGSRLFAVGYVEIDGKLYTRSYYKSNSQGVWRVASHRGDRGWFGKGIGEKLMSLPTPVQQRLSILDKNPLNFSDPNVANNIFYGGLEYRPGRSSQYANLPEDFKQGLSNQRLGKLGSFTDPDNPTTWIWTDPNYAPDFNKITQTYNHAACPNQICKDVDAFIVRSRDNKIEYLFFRDKQTGKVWIASSEIVDSRLNSYGIHRTAVDLDRLAMPIWEYGEQIPQNYVGRKLSDGSPYSDASAFVDQLEIIQDAKKAISAFDLASQTPDSIDIQRFFDDLTPTLDGLNVTPAGPSLGDWFASSPLNPSTWKLPSLKLPEIKLPTMPWNQTDADRLVRQLAGEGRTITPERATQLLDALPDSLDASERLVIAGALARSSDTQGVVTRHVNELNTLLGDVKQNRKNADAISTYFQERLKLSESDAIHFTDKLTGSPEKVFEPQALTAPAIPPVAEAIETTTSRFRWPWEPKTQVEVVSRAFAGSEHQLGREQVQKLAEVFPHATQPELAQLSRALDAPASLTTSDGIIIPEKIIRKTQNGLETMAETLNTRVRALTDDSANHQYGAIYQTSANQYVAVVKASDTGKFYSYNVIYESGNWRKLDILREVDDLTSLLPKADEIQGFILPDLNDHFVPENVTTLASYGDNLSTLRHDILVASLSDSPNTSSLVTLFDSAGFDVSTLSTAPKPSLLDRIRIWWDSLQSQSQSFINIARSTNV